ncbi:MAG: MoaD/ThiS family protein [Chloroflexi bacterium]|nr:MoaD/ThiS family protein [Chloroflexota bacterium]
MKVKIYATLRPIVGGANVPAETQPGQPVQDLIDEMVGRWPDLRPEMVDDEGNLLDRIHVFVNGRRISYLQGTDTIIPEGANISIFPPVGGG